MKPMPLLAQKIISGLIAAWFGMVAFGFVIGMFTYFLGSIPGAIIGFVVGFRWGFRRVGTASTLVGAPLTVGDTAFLVIGFFGFIWLAMALPDLLFGFSGPYKGHPLGVILMLLGWALSPFVALAAQKQSRRLASPLREIVGIASVVVFLSCIGLWWNWAVARDAAYSQSHPFGLLQQRHQNPL